MAPWVWCFAANARYELYLWLHTLGLALISPLRRGRRWSVQRETNDPFTDHTRLVLADQSLKVKLPTMTRALPYRTCGGAKRTTEVPVIDRLARNEFEKWTTMPEQIR